MIGPVPLLPATVYQLPATLQRSALDLVSQAHRLERLRDHCAAAELVEPVVNTPADRAGVGSVAKLVRVGIVGVVAGPLAMALGELPDRFNNLLGLRAGRSRMHREADPTGFLGLVAAVDLVGDRLRMLRRHVEKIMSVRAGARAAAAHLDAEAVV